MKTIKHLSPFLLILSLLTLSACGWQLRGFNQGQLPEKLALKTRDPYTQLARQLQQTLVRRGVTVDPSAAVTLWLSEEEREKRTVAVTSIGSAAQYELHVSVSFAYITEQVPMPLPTLITTKRSYDFIAGSNLASTEEEQILMTEMRQELINRILAASLKINEQQTAPRAETEATAPTVPEQVLHGAH